MESLGIRSPRERWFSHFSGSFRVSKSEVSAPEPAPPPPVQESVELTAAQPADSKSRIRRLYQTIGGSILLALTVAGIGNWVGPHSVPVTPQPAQTVQVAPDPVVKAPAPPVVAAPAPKVEHVAPKVTHQPVHHGAHHVAHHAAPAHHRAAVTAFNQTKPIFVAPELQVPDLTPPSIDLVPMDPIPDFNLSWQNPIVTASPVQVNSSATTTVAPAQVDSSATATIAAPLADTTAPTLGVQVPPESGSKVNTGLEVGSVIPLAGTAVETVTALNAGNAALALGAQAQSLGAAAQAAAAAGNLQQAASLGQQAQLDAARATALGNKAEAAANVAKVTSIVGGSVAVVDGGIDIGKGVHQIHQANKLTRQVDSNVHQLADNGQLTPDLAHQADQAKHNLHHLKVNGEHRTAKGGAKVVFGGMMIASPFTGPAAPIVGGVGAAGYIGTSVAGHVHPIKAVKAIGHVFHHPHAKAADIEIGVPVLEPIPAPDLTTTLPLIPLQSFDLTPGEVAPAPPSIDVPVPSTGSTRLNTGLEIGRLAPMAGTAVETVQAISLGNEAMSLGAQATSLGQAAQAAALAGNLQQAQTLGAEAQQLGAKATAVGAHAQAAANIATPLTIVSGSIAVVDGGIDVGKGLHTVHQANKLQHQVDDQVITLAENGQLTPGTVQQYDTTTQDLHHAKVAGEHRAEKGGAKVVFGGMMIASPFTGPAAPIVGGIGAAGYLGTTLAGHVHPVKAFKSVVHHIGHIFHHNPKASADIGRATSAAVPKTGASVMDRFLATHCTPGDQG